MLADVAGDHRHASTSCSGRSTGERAAGNADPVRCARRRASRSRRRTWSRRSAIIAKYPPGRQASAVLPLLDLAQAQHGGWLPRAAMDYVAESSACRRSAVYEVATFYYMFNLMPVGQYPAAGLHDDAVLAARLGRRGRAPASASSASASAKRPPDGAVHAAARSSAWAPAPTRRWCWSTTISTRTSTTPRPRQLLEALQRGERPTPGPQNGRQTSTPDRRPDDAAWTRVTEPTMLHDRDRIFTNLYGEHDWRLRGRARARRLGRHQGADRARAATGSSSEVKDSRACAAAAAPASRPA